MFKRLAAVLLLFCMVLPVKAENVLTFPTLNGAVTITTGNTFQTILAAVGPTVGRRSLTIQNNNATDSCWLFIGGGSATKGTSILLTAAQPYIRYYPYIPSDAIQATCASTSDTLYVDTQ